MAERTLLTGWGRTAPSSATLHRVADAVDISRLTRASSDRGIVARGLGRSYGDPAQVAGGDVIDMTGLDRLVELDVDRGYATAEAGLSLDALLRAILPLGWFAPVTPGTRLVTLGGSFAADVHGKNHHVDGSFAQHVERLRLVTGTGEELEVTPDSDADVFWATAGGMGLTGTLTELTLKLRPVETSCMVVDTDRTSDLDSTLDRIQQTDGEADYSVAWIDSTARGSRLGRAVLSRGRHATVDELPVPARADPLRFDPRTLLRVPVTAPRGALNRVTVAAFNDAWYLRAPRHRSGELQSLSRFFYPLDAVMDWNRIYGPDGFVQYQFVVPPDATETLRHCIERIAAARLPSFLTVLKRFGPGNPGMLSFPTDGWTLALDFPVTRSLGRVLDELDDAIAAAGGRVYLAKDARLKPEHVPVMYPRLPEWRTVRGRLDPGGRLTSDLARRLGL